MGKNVSSRLAARSRSACIKLLVPVLLCCACGGCNSRPNVSPGLAVARQSLETALTAWKDGQKAGRIETHDPPLEIADGEWLRGKKLASYEIVSEKIEADGFPWFSVRLQMSQPGGTQEARYVVKGVKRLWIYREEDLNRSLNWEGYKEK